MRHCQICGEPNMGKDIVRKHEGQFFFLFSRFSGATSIVNRMAFCPRHGCAGHPDLCTLDCQQRVGYAKHRSDECIECTQANDTWFSTPGVVIVQWE